MNFSFSFIFIFGFKFHDEFFIQGKSTILSNNCQTSLTLHNISNVNCWANVRPNVVHFVVPKVVPLMVRLKSKKCAEVKLISIISYSESALNHSYSLDKNMFGYNIVWLDVLIDNPFAVCPSSSDLFGKQITFIDYFGIFHSLPFKPLTFSFSFAWRK